MYGTVKYINDDKQYGYIRSLLGDISFAFDVVSDDIPAIGDIVEVKYFIGRRGLVATSVAPIVYGCEIPPIQVTGDELSNRIVSAIKANSYGPVDATTVAAAYESLILAGFSPTRCAVYIKSIAKHMIPAIGPSRDLGQALIVKDDYVIIATIRCIQPVGRNAPDYAIVVDVRLSATDDGKLRPEWVDDVVDGLYNRIVWRRNYNNLGNISDIADFASTFPLPLPKWEYDKPLNPDYDLPYEGKVVVNGTIVGEIRLIPNSNSDCMGFFAY